MAYKDFLYYLSSTSALHLYYFKGPLLLRYGENRFLSTIRSPTNW